MSVLFPLFLGGLALVALPFLIHQIRRPERKVVRFSSLMFVPKIKKEVIERRRLQHLLLMLLRMLLLLLLALAFSRPYLQSKERRVGVTQAPEFHMILIDTSYSMAQGDALVQAKSRAREVLAEISREARVGVAGFDATTRQLSSLEQGDAASTHEAAAAAVDSVLVTQSDTRYLQALRFAESRLLTNLTDDTAEEACVLHMISDFRRNGMPDPLPAWRLSGRIRFLAYQVGETGFANAGISDAAVRLNEQGEPVVVARVKNHDSRELSLDITLELQGREPLVKKVGIAPGNASLVRFPLAEHGARLSGRLSIPTDDFLGDNLRYLAWRAPEGKRVLLIGNTDTQYSSGWFLAKALQAYGNRTWKVSSVPPAQLKTFLKDAAPPDLMVVVEGNGFNESVFAQIRAYVGAGGKLLLCLGETPDRNLLNTGLLNSYGIQSLGPRFSETREDQFASMAWVNFDHPAFFAFRGARFNDFSTVRFHNYHRLELPKKAAVLARISGDDGALDPAMVSLSHQEGKVLLWAFCPKLAWTNLPKHVKFLPVLQEGLSHLTGGREQRLDYTVGDTFPLQRLESETGTWLVRGPNGEENRYVDRASLNELSLRQAGLISFRENEDQAWQDVAAVNIPIDEGDPAVIPVRELALKLTSNSGGDRLGQVANPFAAEHERRHEWGYWLVVVLGLLVIVETLYAVRLSARRQPAQA